VFPGNVWVFGRGRPGVKVAEDHPVAPCSDKGAARAACEAALRASGARSVIVRLPEFFGPFVTTLTGPPLAALAKGGTATWFGPPDVPVELGYMPDAGRALLAAALAEGVDGATFHWPGHVVTPRAFLEAARARAGGGRARFVPTWVVRAAGLFSGRAKGFADILHLWEDPVVQDGARWRARFGSEGTSLEAALDATLAWHRANPDAWMH
jgi:nucleoside-diphosphate-sugar epimerase